MVYIIISQYSGRQRIIAVSVDGDKVVFEIKDLAGIDAQLFQLPRNPLRFPARDDQKIEVASRQRFG